MTHAVKLCEDRSPAAAQDLVLQLYALRSKCFLKQDQFFYAMQDADTLIRCSPESPQGYARKAEALLAANSYAEAVPLLQKSFSLSSREDKEHYLELARKCKREVAREATLDLQYPWVGAAVGIVISVAGVVADVAMAPKPDLAFVSHPLAKMIVVILVAATCFVFTKMYRTFMRNQRRSLLDPPIDLLGHGSDIKKME